MNQAQRHHKVLRFNYRAIENVYGRDEVDVFGDDIAECVNAISEWQGQYSLILNIDASTGNPLLDCLVIEIHPMPDDVFQRLRTKIASLGVEENGQSPRMN